MAEISKSKLLAGKVVAVAFVLAAVVLGAITLWATNVDPRTDDANVVANYIGIAPEVNGPIVSLPIRDNQLVHKGDLLYEIDSRPYEYQLQQAISAKNNLEQQIIDERRKIASQTLNAEITTAGRQSSAESVNSQEANSLATEKVIQTQEATLKNAEAQFRLAVDTLARTEPLLARHFVTAQQIDQLRTNVRSAQESVTQAQTTLDADRARFLQAQAEVRQATVAGKQQKLRAEAAFLDIDRLQTLLSQLPAKEAQVKSAAYDVQRCWVYAPFDARVTDLTISVGQYARTGGQVFTLIDTTAWWVLGNYKETQLRHLAPGMPVDVYVLNHQSTRFRGVVESIGFGVTPEDITPTQAGGLPSTTRTLNWVRLAQRFPVRVRVLDPSPDLFRLGASATTIVRSGQAPLAIPPDPNVYNKAVYESSNGNSQPVAH